jgi:hypothetical protein
VRREPDVGNNSMSWVNLVNKPMSCSWLVLQDVTVAGANLARIGLRFDCLDAKPPLCIYKQREDSRC